MAINSSTTITTVHFLDALYIRSKTHRGALGRCGFRRVARAGGVPLDKRWIWSLLAFCFVLNDSHFVCVDHFRQPSPTLSSCGDRPSTAPRLAQSTRGDQTERPQWALCVLATAEHYCRPPSRRRLSAWILSSMPLSEFSNLSRGRPLIFQSCSALRTCMLCWRRRVFWSRPASTLAR